MRNIKLLCAAVLSLLGTSGCAGNTPDASQPGGGLQDYRQQALFDRDSRNNEDASLGVKPYWAAEQGGQEPGHYAGRQTLDMTNEHFSNDFWFHSKAVEPIKQVSGIEDAYVLVTETNAYVAVIPQGFDPAAEAAPQVSEHVVKKNGGTGLFANPAETGNLSFSESPRLPNSLADEVRLAASGHLPANVDQIYVSSNPNFVQRVRFYAKELERTGEISIYSNEFNTLVQRAFPRTGNGQLK